MTSPLPRFPPRRALALAALLGVTAAVLLERGDGQWSPLFARLAASHRAAAEHQVDLLMALHRRLPDRGWAVRALAVTERARAGGVLGGAGGPLPVRALDAAGLDRLPTDGTAWLFTWLGERHAYVWWLTDEGSVAYEVTAASRPALVARRLHDNLSSGAAAVLGPQVETDAASLAGALLAPGPRLRRQRLAVVADGVLAAVPWAVLPSPWRAGRRLLDDRDVVLLPSASLLVALRRRAERSGRDVPGGPSR